jgi:hypothetical protein
MYMPMYHACTGPAAPVPYYGLVPWSYSLEYISCDVR